MNVSKCIQQCIQRSLVRSVSTSSQMSAKQGYFLHKLLEKEKIIEKRMQARKEAVMKSVTTIPSQATRRQTILNNLYLECISDILANEFTNELEKLRIRIEGVKITHDLRLIKVYWSSELIPVADEKTVSILKEIAPKVKKELLSMRHMGIIPAIQFVHFIGDGSESVFSLLHNLKEMGELEDVEPAPLPLHENPQVYGLDRAKIMAILAKKTLPSDAVTLPTESIDAVKKREIMRNLRNKSNKTKKYSLKEDFRWQQQAYESLIEDSRLNEDL